jgi:PAS domain S-box-containing protein
VSSSVAQAPAASAADDPVAAAVRAAIGAAWRPVAVFDENGICLVATRAYVVQSARLGRSAEQRRVERRAAFSPDGRRTWTLVTLPARDGERSAAEFVDAVAEAMPIMFSAKDLQSRYVFMNQYQAELYGTTPAAAVGRTAAELIGEDYGRYTRAIDEEVFRTGRARPAYEESFAGVGTVPRHWLTTKLPLRHASGEVWGLATVSIDITERKRLEESLREAKEQAEAGSLAKSRFLAAMSHELRTPLNAVLGFAELMQQEALGPLGRPEYREYAAHILRSGAQLLEMISDLLDFARAEAGNLQLASGELELSRLVRGVLAAARERAEAGGKTLPVALEAALPPGFVALRGDEQRLRQVLRALVDNALKFTPAGGRVVVSLGVPAAGGAEIVVADSGIGMSAAQVARAFEPFWQADAGIGRKRQGAGIGLKLAHALVALHGGTLTLASREGEGTRVTLRLPPAPPAPDA